MTSAVIPAVGIGAARFLLGEFDPPNIRSITWPQLDAKGQQTFNVDKQPIFYGLYGYVPISEHHTDELDITDNPVEQGSSVTDNAYKRPALLNMRIGWTNGTPLIPSSGLANSLINVINGFLGGSPGQIRKIYDQVLQLQVNRTLVNIETGKRSYGSMLIKMVSEETTIGTEYALILSLQIKQIIFVNTKLVSVPSQLVMKTPQINAATQTNGTQQLQTASNANINAFPPLSGAH